jgi:hypothetical protein
MATRRGTVLINGQPFSSQAVALGCRDKLIEQFRVHGWQELEQALCGASLWDGDEVDMRCRYTFVVEHGVRVCEVQPPQCSWGARIRAAVRTLAGRR